MKKMRRMKERILSLVLTVVMMISLLPITAKAEEVAVVQDLSSWVSIVGDQLIITPPDDSVGYMVGGCAEEHINGYNYYKGAPVSLGGDFNAVYKPDYDYGEKFGVSSMPIMDGDTYCVVTVNRNINTGGEYGYYAVSGVHAFKCETNTPAIIAQPTSANPTFDLQYGDMATYQWYENETTVLTVTDTAADNTIQPESTKWNYVDNVWKINKDDWNSGWVPFEIRLKKGDTLELTFSKVASYEYGIELGHLVEVEDYTEYEPLKRVSRDEIGSSTSISFTVPSDGVYYVGLGVDESDKDNYPFVTATVERRTSVPGQTTKTFTGSAGTYVCMANWGSYVLLSDSVIVEDAPTYPLGSVEPLGENSVTIDENNVVHFDIPENTGDYVYLTTVMPVSALGEMTAEQYISLLTLGKNKDVVDTASLDMDNVDINKNLQIVDGTVFITNEEASAIPEWTVDQESVAFIYKFHKDNVISEEYASAAENPYGPISDTTYIYAVYGVHAEVVTPTDSGDSGEVEPEIEAPAITGQPQNATVEVGQKATFTVTATGDDLSYQWMIDRNDGKGFVNLASTTATHTTTVVDMSCNGFKYKCIVSNSVGAVTSNVVTLTVTEKEVVHTHDLTLVPAKAATCTEEGNKAYYTCSGCDSLFTDAEGTKTTTAEAVKIAALGHDMTAATCKEPGVCKRSGCDHTVDALGHDWSGEWTIIKEATATEEGKKETYCTRKCGQKKVAVIPIEGEEDEDAGNIEKDAEVDPEAPVDEATIDNKKDELLEGDIFTEEEKELIEAGEEARVWLEIGKTDEDAIAADDKAKIEKEAADIMGDDAKITYFDADLFKQVGNGKKTEITEPGMDIEITIVIPKELLNQDETIAREYKIIRLHEGEVDVISGTFDPATGEFSFKTDRFSTYAIVYDDVPVDADDKDDVPKTGVVSTSAYAGTLMLLSGLGLVFCSSKKKSNE